MTTSTLLHYRYAKRPSIVGAYHVWTHDVSAYLGCVYRLDDVPDAPKWQAGNAPTLHRSREDAARALDELTRP